jgi:hypothetical protein
MKAQVTVQVPSCGEYRYDIAFGSRARGNMERARDLFARRSVHETAAHGGHSRSGVCPLLA